MKYICSILIFLLWSNLTSASDTTIVFRQISYPDLFNTAKIEKKGVMLYFHFDGCGACKKMETTAFKDKAVSNFYNTHFINYEINTRNEEGVEINKKYNIQKHPTFIFLDNSANELHRLVGVFSPDEFYRQAQTALRDQKNLTNFHKQYDEGNRSPDFLFDYVYMLRNADLLDSIVVNEYLDAIDIDEYSLEKNIRFIYEFCLHNFNTFIPYKNTRFDFLINNRDLFSRYLDSNQINTRIVWILSNAIHEAIEEKDDIAFSQILDRLKEYDTGEIYYFKEVDGRTTGRIQSGSLLLSSMLSFYEKNEDKFNYFKTLNIFISTIWNDANELNNFAWTVFEGAKVVETEKIQAAIHCSIRSIELEDNYQNNDTYAWLLFKSGDQKNALKQAEKAIAIAKKAKSDYSETRKLRDIIMKKLNEKNNQQ